MARIDIRIKPWTAVLLSRFRDRDCSNTKPISKYLNIYHLIIHIKVIPRNISFTIDTGIQIKYLLYISINNDHIMYSELAFWLQIGVLPAYWHLGYKLAFWLRIVLMTGIWRFGCILAFRLRIGISAANRRFGWIIVVRQQTGV